MRLLARNQARCGNGPSVDHRIARTTCSWLKADGVERFTGRFNTDFFQYLGTGVVLECQSINERLRNGLHGEMLARVARLVHMAFGRDQADAEPVRVGLGEFRNVGGHLTVSQRGMAGVKFLKVILDWRKGRGGEFVTHVCEYELGIGILTWAHLCEPADAAIFRPCGQIISVNSRGISGATSI